jgi:negative regulator of flagellin synthesis FlgM
MVDSIQSPHMAKFRILPGQAQGPAQSTGAGQSADGTKAVDKVMLHSSSLGTLVADLTEKGPPFDAEKVSRIKQAISDNNYPVDRDRLADTLAQDFRAMNGA